MTLSPGKCTFELLLSYFDPTAPKPTFELLLGNVGVRFNCFGEWGVVAGQADHKTRCRMEIFTKENRAQSGQKLLPLQFTPLGKEARFPQEAFTSPTQKQMETLTSLNKEVRPFSLGDNSIWSFPPVSSLSDYSIWRS